MSEELKRLLEQQGEAFDAFKNTHDEQMAELEKRGANDPVLMERFEKIETSLDKAVEGKAAIDAALEAERKEREDLEARLNRVGIQGGTEAEAKQALELKEFNVALSGLAAERKRQFTPLDQEGLDEYKAAFNHMMRHGKDDLSGDEVKTLSVGSDPDGGYFVTPDVSGRIVSKVFETSQMRQVANVQTISTDKLQGIEDLDEAGAGYAGEKTQGSDTKTPQTGEWEIPVWWLDTEPKATQQMLDDPAIDMEAWLSGKVSAKLGRFEEAEFVAGSVGKIRGLTSYNTLADSGSGVVWGKLGHIKTGVNGGFAASDPGDAIHDVVGLLKNEYLPNSRFMTRRTVITKIRKFKDGQGNYLWQPSFVLGTPEMIVGHGVSRAEDMPALGTGSLSLAFGDFERCYQIVDRQGIRVLRDPFTSKPYIKFYTTKRTGGGVVNYEAAKFLKFAA